MAKLIIWVGGKPLINGYKIREFLWSVAHNCYIYEGREINEADFNAKFEKAHRNNADLHPQVKVVEFSAEVPKVSVQPVKSTESATGTIAKTVEFDREITLEEAEEVVARLAPDRLKKRPGRPPRVMEVA